MQPIRIKFFQWFVIVTVAVSTRAALGWRTFYVSPSKNSDTISCPVDHCYSLQDVINNQSYFLDSNTTLELMPGRYNITGNVGQVIIYQAQNLLVKKSVVDQNVTIHCNSNTTFGLTVVGSSNVTISGLEIFHCSAALTYMNLIKRMLRYVHYEDTLSQYFRQWLDHPTFCDSEFVILPCKATVFFIGNQEVTMQQTAILHSQHIGLFAIKNDLMVIVSSLMAYNNINCILYVNTNMYTPLDGAYETVIMESSFLFGQATDVSDSLASGLNIFLLVDTLYVREKRAKAATAQAVYRLLDNKRQPSTSYVKVLNTSFVNNQGHCGNFYLVVFVFTMDFDVGVVIKNLSAVSDVNFPGLVVYLLESNSLFSIRIEECVFLGCCMVLSEESDNIVARYVDLEIIGVNINESRCNVAMFINVSALSLINTTISYNHFSIVNATNANLIFKENSHFHKNQGAFSITKGKVTFENVILDSNSAIRYDSVFYCDLSEVFFFGSANFSNNTGREGGAIVAYGSVLHFKDGTTILISNSADNGGAISLNDNSVMNIDGANIIFVENKAEIYGGGIFVEDKSLWLRKTSQKICFVQLKKNGTGCLYFLRNKAGLAGNAIFGGWIDVCIQQIVNYSFSNVFKLYSDHDNDSLTVISSNPSRVCLCYNFEPSRHEDSMTISLFPGQSFEISAVAVGQLFGIVPTIVKAEVQNRQFSIIDDLQKWQDVGKQCTQLKYTIHSPNQEETMLLTVNNQYVPYQNQSWFTINILLNNCSLGFMFDSKLNTCACHYLLVQQKIQCNTSSHTIHRSSDLWITAKSHSGILIHHHCPFDYCMPYDLSLNLSTPDHQCANNRSGILCGKCQPGLSQVLGTSNCRKCSNRWLLLLLPFALAGVALVVCLMVLNLSVSTGTINGLIFYANIIRANNVIFFPGQSANMFLSWFIAWLNLDLGIETCFYDGLNAYVKIWLQFAFPLYIWLLVIAIIISSHYSIKVAKVCGMNSVQVLATLFFVSYAKLLRVTIAIFQPAHLLKLASNTKEVVWNYDGNISYLEGKHIPLFITALLFFILLFIPYIFILAGVQILQRFSHHKPFFWVNKLKPLLDAYTGPYKDKHRYWIGYLLFVRIGLFLLISTNASGNSAFQLFGIILVVFFLFAHLAFIGGVYKKWPLNLLEHFFLLNLAALSAGTLYCLTTGLNTHAFTQVSVSTALISTVFITLYHCLLINETLKRKLFSAYKLFIPNVSNRVDTYLNTESDSSSCNNNNPLSQVTQSVVELREPLLGSENI